MLNNNLLVLNVLDVESYLYGVVGEEMGGGAPLQAYCAQAVASRSYALAMRGLSPWYDVGSDTGAQAYGGYTSEQEFACSGDNPVVDAVQRTSGQVLKYARRPGQGLLPCQRRRLHRGRRERLGHQPALPQGRAEPWGCLCGNQALGRRAPIAGRRPVTGQTWAPSSEWARILDIQVSRNRTQVTTDRYRQITVNFMPGTTTVSGRVTQVTVVGTGGTETYNRDDIRQALGLQSTLFDVDIGGQLEGLDAQGQIEALSGDEVCVRGRTGPAVGSLGSGSLYIIGSGNRLVTQSASSDEITFTGHGDGHGVGMSQWGAIGMADNGDNYQEILELYYDQGKNDGNLQIVGNYGN